jgi:hypothetical protein
MLLREEERLEGNHPAPSLNHLQRKLKVFDSVVNQILP